MALRSGGSATTAVVSSASRTSSGNSGALGGYDAASELRVQLDVTASSGTGPTLDVVVEDSLDGTNWNTIGSFTQAAGTTREVIDITSPFADQIRVSWTLGGTTPDFTFSVVAYAREG